jgi:hypothetical protein
VPPELTQRALAALKAAGAIATHWQHGGRYGSRIAAELEPPDGQLRPRRTIPVLAAAAEGISAFLAAVQKAAPPAALLPPAALPPAAAGLPAELQAVLRSSGHVALRYLPQTPPRLPRLEAFDARVHPERAPSNSAPAVTAAAAAAGSSRSLNANAGPERVTQQPEAAAAAAAAAAFTFVELFAGLGVRNQPTNQS